MAEKNTIDLSCRKWHDSTSLSLPKSSPSDRVQNVAQFLKRRSPDNPQLLAKREGCSLRGESTTASKNEPTTSPSLRSEVLSRDPYKSSLSYKRSPTDSFCKDDKAYDRILLQMTSPDAPGKVNWHEYKNYLVRVWEENSLNPSSLEVESSTLPLLSSPSEDIPFAIDLLTNDDFFPAREKVSDIHLHLGDVKCSPPKEPQDRSESQGHYTSPFFYDAKKSPVIKALPSECSTTIDKVMGLPPQSADIKNTYLIEEKKIQNAAIIYTNPHSTPSKLTTQINKHLPKPGANVKERVGQPPSTKEYDDSTPCSTHTDEINGIKRELALAQIKIKALSNQMAHQSSHLEHLFEGKRCVPKSIEGFPESQPSHTMSYPLFSQGCKTPPHALYPPAMGAYGYNPHHVLGRRPSWQYPYEPQRGRHGVGLECMEEPSRNELDRRTLESLRDRIVALQMQNVELNLFLKKEELRRKEAEEAVRKEKEQVQKLQNSLQDLNSSTLVMDPTTYKQVADKYIAARKKPVRRTHTCHPSIPFSDLVCDSSRLRPTQNATNHSNSCPSSPLGSKEGRKKSVTPASRLSPNILPSDESISTLSPIQVNVLADPEPSGRNPSSTWSVEPNGSTPMNSKEYQDLLDSLESLGVSSDHP